LIAVDTDVLVRLIVADEPRQAERARRLFAKHDVWISTSVLLETGWVLRGVYEFSPAAVAGALRVVLGLPNVATTAPHDVNRALEAVIARGRDFADALHVALLPEPVDGFMTFDRSLLSRGADLGKVRAA
jgi:predicted nucleic acid-binding protein